MGNGPRGVLVWMTWSGTLTWLKPSSSALCTKSRDDVRVRTYLGLREVDTNVHRFFTVLSPVDRNACPKKRS